MSRMSLRAALGLVCLGALCPGVSGCDDAVSGHATPDAMLDGMPHGSPDALPDRAPDAMPDGMPDAAPDGMPDAAPDSMPDTLAGPTPTTPLDAPLPAEPSPVGLPDDAILYDAIGRPCRGDLYVVDAAPERPAPLVDPAPVAAALRARARRDFAPWFCAPGGPCDGADRVEVGVEALLDAADVGPAGAGRFHRFWFEVDGARLTARDAAQCDIVSALRAAVAAHGALDDAYVARACDAVAQSPAAPTEAMRRWHLDHLGLPDDADPPRAAAHVALVDTAPDPAVAAALGVTVRPGPAPALHGTAMAALVRQVAPGAQIAVFPALTPDHTGPVGDVARSIARALSALPADAPRIINLSLGWPPELNRRTGLVGPILDGRDGQQCETTEDPTGAPVRWALMRAAEAGVMVIAAGGNRADAVWLDARVPSDEDARDRCAADWRAEIRAQPAPLFYPAQWGLERSCADGEDPLDGRRLALPVAAHDARDRAAGLTTPFTYATLMAPGQHVVVDGPARRRARSVCVDGDTPPPAAAQDGVRLPATLSGTSVAAALTSGLVARWLGALAGRADVDPAAISPRQIELALRATATPVCAGPRVFGDLNYRRIGWPGLARLADCAALPAVLDCLDAEDDDRPLAVSDTLAACEAALAACAVELEPLEDCDADPPPTPDWNDAECGPLRPADPAAPDLSRACAAGACPFEGLAPDRYSVGGLGPQPQDPWCPDCRFTIERVPAGDPSQATLDIALNPAAPADTLIVGPILEVQTETGERVYVNLTDYVPRDYWKPGAGFTLADLKLSVPGAPVLWSKLSARLLLYVQQPDGKTIVRDVSPLRVVVR